MSPTPRHMAPGPLSELLGMHLSNQECMSPRADPETYPSLTASFWTPQSYCYRNVSCDDHFHGHWILGPSVSFRVYSSTANGIQLQQKIPCFSSIGLLVSGNLSELLRSCLSGQGFTVSATDSEISTSPVVGSWTLYNLKSEATL